MFQISDHIVKGESNSDKYWSLQYSLYVTPFVLVLGGFAFLYTSAFIVADKENCKSLTQGSGSDTVNQNDNQNTTNSPIKENSPQNDISLTKL